MALILETGEGLIDSNSYADIAAGDAYHDNQLYPEPWFTTESPRKETALIMATTLIDANWNFYGSRVTDVQALAWPRIGAPNRDLQPLIYWSNNPLAGLAQIGNGYYSAVWPSNLIPDRLVRAVCEMARLLLIKNRPAAAEPSSRGISSFSIGSGALSFSFNSSDLPGLFTAEVSAYLTPLGSSSAVGRSVIPLVR